MISKLFTFFLLIGLISCKTQEDIRREKTMENINEKINQTQQVNANVSTRFQTIEEQLLKLNGSVEELDHKKDLEQKDINLLKENNKKQNELINELTKKYTEQSQYLEQVLKTLKELTEKKPEPIEKERPKEEVSLKSGLLKFKENKFEEAKSILSDILETKKSSKGDKTTSLFYLGVIAFKQKNYDDSKVYFSRVFTETPESSFAPDSLLYLAKTFSALKLKSEAKETLEELISRFPHSKQAKEAQKIKGKL